MSDRISRARFNDSHDNAAYDPRTPRNAGTARSSNAETTPSQREFKAGMSAAAKRRVNRATEALDGKQCVVEHTSENNHPQYAHCLPRAAHSDLLDHLELAWKMKHNTLNVDTRYNVIRWPKLHKAFDANKWLLLPEASIVDRYTKAVGMRKRFPVINDNVYKYTLIAHPRMWDIPIHRQMNPTPEPPLRLLSEDFTYYPHPYLDFPEIRSHVHPRYIICNSGAKLENGIDQWQEEYGPSVTDLLQKVYIIWKEWKGSALPAKIKTSTADDDDDDDNNNDDNDENDQDDNSEMTGHYRIRLGKRKMRGEEASPTPGGSRAPRPLTDGIWLDDETLNEYNQNISSPANDSGLKKQLILNWLESVSDAETGSRLKDQAHARANITLGENTEVDLVA